MRQANFGYIIRKKSYYDPTGLAIVEQATGNEYTYRELERRSNSIARELRTRGVEKGDRVCGLFRNSIEFFDLFFACCKLGAVATPFNFRLSSGEIDYLLDDCDPSLFVYESVFEKKVADLNLSNIPSVHIDVTFDNMMASADEMMARDDDWSAFYTRSTDEIEIADGFDTPAVLLYTSGSTGRPKGVPLSHKNLFFSSVGFIIDTELTSNETTITSSPIFHVGGLNIFTLPLLHVGGTVILQQEFDPVENWQMMATHDVTRLFAIPTMLNAMVNVDGWREHDLSALELVMGGGEPVPGKLKKAFASIDVPCVAGYGLTETTDGSLILRPEDAANKPPKCNGKTFTHVDAKVVGEDGTELPPGEAGELLHRGPTVADEYLGLPEETAKAWTGEWFHTGDIAEVDENGFYHIHGRMDDMIISGGENIYPSEVEDALYSHPDIKEAVVFGSSDETWGEIVKAVIVITDNKPLSHDELRTFLDRDLAKYKHPKEISFDNELPKSGTGKIERQTVIEQHSDV